MKKTTNVVQNLEGKEFQLELMKEKKRLGIEGEEAMEEEVSAIDSCNS